MMRCNKKNVSAALGGLAFLAMPMAANAQGLGVRVGNLGIGSSTTNGLVSLGGANTGLTGLTSGLTSGLTGGTSLSSVSLAPITTTGLVSTNTGAISANVLGGGSVLNAGLAPISANVGNGLVTLGTPGIGANVLGNNDVATISTGGPLVATIRGVDPNNPVIPIPVSNPTTTLGVDSFFSSSSTSWRMNGGGGGGGGSSGGPPSNDGGSAESSSQVCERVLRRPGSFSRAAVSQCRKVVASLVRRR